MGLPLQMAGSMAIRSAMYVVMALDKVVFNMHSVNLLLIQMPSVNRLLDKRVNDRQAKNVNKVGCVIGVQVEAIQQGGSGNQAVAE